MKYGYGDIPKKEIIKNYKVFMGNIIVTFLDDSSCTIPYTKENETKIINTMLQQAKNRDKEKGLVTELKKFRNLCLTASGSSLLSSAVTLCAFVSTQNYSWLFCAATLTSVSVIYGCRASNFEDERYDVEKYSTYLSMLDEIGIADSDLNINSVDNHSLREIKQKKKHLK